jgi:hypothetical protein
MSHRPIRIFISIPDTALPKLGQQYVRCEKLNMQQIIPTG